MRNGVSLEDPDLKFVAPAAPIRCLRARMKADWW